MRDYLRQYHSISAPCSSLVCYYLYRKNKGSETGNLKQISVLSKNGEKREHLREKLIFSDFKYRVMAHMGGHWPLTAASRFRARIIPYGVCGEQSGM
jgi:hypothetical protein